MPGFASIVVFFGHGMAVKRSDEAVEEKSYGHPPHAKFTNGYKVSFTCKISSGITCEQHNQILDLCVKSAQPPLRDQQTLEELGKAVIQYADDDMNYKHYIYSAQDLLRGEGAAKTLVTINKERFRGIPVEVFESLILSNQLLEANRKSGKLYCEFNTEQATDYILTHIQKGKPLPQHLSQEFLMFLRLGAPKPEYGTTKLLTEGDRLRYEKAFCKEYAEMQFKLEIVSKLKIAFAIKHSVDAQASGGASAATASGAQDSKVAVLCPFICDNDDLTPKAKQKIFADKWKKRESTIEAKCINASFDGDFFNGKWDYHEVSLVGNEDIFWDTCRGLESHG